MEPFRMTRQRRIILEELAKVRTHPTADEVHRMVRRRLPRVSLGTVYRNLERLSALGEILKLNTDGTRMRYDGTATEHYHIVCTQCGRVGDMHTSFQADMNRKAQADTDFEITGHELTFRGLCPECRRKKPVD